MEMTHTLNAEVFCKLKNALSHFRNKDFTDAVDSYSQALTLLTTCHSFQQAKESIISLKATCLAQQKSYPSALEEIDRALTLNSFHELSLLRRSKIYLKMGDLEKGLTDLEAFVELAPDLDTQELINQFENAIDVLEESENKYNLKKRVSELKQTEQEEELLLSFCKLRLIDRKSKILPRSSKKESVYFGEECIFPIEVDDNDDDHNSGSPQKSRSEKISFTVQMKKEKMRQQMEELHSEENEEDRNFKVVTTPCKSKGKKSILKTNSLIQMPSSLQLHSNASQSNSIIDVLKIKDIDGKLIHKSKSEIKFRQSEFVTSFKLKQRKSILKVRLSDILPQERRKSGFLDIKNIDGKVLADSMTNYAEAIRSNSSLEGEEEFNIYGASMMSEDEVNSIMSQWMGEEKKDKKENHTSSSIRKSAMKTKSSAVPNKPKEAKEAKKRTVLFKE